MQFLDLTAQYKLIKEEINVAIKKVLDSCIFIGVMYFDVCLYPYANFQPGCYPADYFPTFSSPRNHTTTDGNSNNNAYHYTSGANYYAAGRDYHTPAKSNHHFGRVLGYF